LFKTKGDYALPIEEMGSKLTILYLKRSFLMFSSVLSTSFKLTILYLKHQLFDIFNFTKSRSKITILYLKQDEIRTALLAKTLF
jgi:hypothetical protein